MSMEEENENLSEKNAVQASRHCTFNIAHNEVDAAVIVDVVRPADDDDGFIMGTRKVESGERQYERKL